MLTSISPLGERARRNRWGTTVAWYAAASTLSGAALGALLGGLSSLVPLSAGARAAALAGLALMAVAADGWGASPGGWHRQVNEDWLGRYRGWVYAAGFGGQLGTGVATIVTTSAVYVTLAAEAGSGSAPASAVLGGIYGLVRALPVMASGRMTTHQRLTDRHRGLVAALPLARRLTAVTLVFATAGWAGLAWEWVR